MNYNDQVADLDKAVSRQQERDRAGKFTSSSSWAPTPHPTQEDYVIRKPQDGQVLAVPMLEDKPFVIEGSITGAVVRSTIQFRQGRSLLYPGVRVFDHVTPKIATKTKQSE